MSVFRKFVCCQVQVSATDCSIVKRSPTESGESLSVVRCYSIPPHLQYVCRSRQNKKERKKEK